MTHSSPHPLAKSLRLFGEHIETLERFRQELQRRGDTTNAGWIEVALSGLRTAAGIVDDLIAETSGEGQANG